ncbi:MAG: chemotaxis protein CheW [Rugosibacter sp.]|nr:chemotaxis protein CheW [Rugosibacter sp.]
MAKLNRREFQEKLSARLIAAQRGEIEQSVLAVESGTEVLPGGRRWLIPLAEAGEILPYPEITTVPLTQAWFLGVANIRGALHSVIDFSAWRGGSLTPVTPAQARILLIGARHGANSALLIERTLGLRPLSGFQLAEDTPDQGSSVLTSSAQPANWQEALVTDDQGMQWSMLNISLLLTSPLWLDITSCQ